MEVLSITLVQSLFSPLTFSLQFFFLETLLKHKTFFFSYSLFFSFLEIAVLDFCETRFVIDLFIFCFSSFLMNKSFFFSETQRGQTWLHKYYFLCRNNPSELIFLRGARLEIFFLLEMVVSLVMAMKTGFQQIRS